LSEDALQLPALVGDVPGIVSEVCPHVRLPEGGIISQAALGHPPGCIVFRALYVDRVAGGRASEHSVHRRLYEVGVFFRSPTSPNYSWVLRSILYQRECGKFSASPNSVYCPLFSLFSTSK
jgi:hypothetical protein